MRTPIRCVWAGLLGRRLLLLVAALCLGSTLRLHADTWGPFTYRRDGNNITITEYNGTDRSVTVPVTINGLPVTAINTYTFWDAWSVTHLTLPATLLNAGNPPFALADSLQSISVASGNPVFSSRDGVLFSKDQTQLVRVPMAWPGETLVVPGTVTRIENEAFSECRNLTRIVLPRGLSELGEQPFSSCHSLTHLEVEDGNPAYRSQEGVLFDARGATLIRCPEGRAGSYSVPAGVTHIGPWAFRACEQLLHVTIPDHVETIGAGAFYQAGLETVQVGRGVTQIGDSAFDNRRGRCAAADPCYGPTETVGARIDLFFVGAVPLAVHPFGDRTVFWGRDDFSEPPRVFHLADAAGWGTRFGGVAVTPWTGEPVILNAPLSTVRSAGYAVQLSAQAIGPKPILYQWLQGDQEVPGATNAVLSLSPLKAVHAGSWRLRVSNAYGSATSEVATVTVRTPTPGGYEEAALALRPVAYWPLDDDSPLDVAQYSPVIDFASGDVGYVFGPALLQEPGATSNTGRSIGLNGTSWIENWNNPAWDVGTGDFTVAAWINPSAFVQSGIAAKGGYSWARGWLFDFSAVGQGTLRLETSLGIGGGQGTVQSDPGVVTLNEWQHVVVSCRRDPAAGPGLNTTGKGWTKIYRNGVQVAAGDIGTGDLNNPNLPFALGTISNWDAIFPGRMDEVALFGEALSAEQVAGLYAAGIGAPPPLRFTRAGEQFTLTWSGGVLQSATDLGNDGQPAGWSDLTAATSPWTLSLTHAANFFRVRTP